VSFVGKYLQVKSLSGVMMDSTITAAIARLPVNVPPCPGGLDMMYYRPLIFSRNIQLITGQTGSPGKL
jgi:hypothetical protein